MLSPLKIALSIGDLDKTDKHLHQFDLIITTSEKLDSLIRHHTPWIKEVKCVIIDEIHLLNDPERGPTLEILITIIKKILKAQIIGLSATIGRYHAGGVLHRRRSAAFCADLHAGKSQ